MKKSGMFNYGMIICSFFTAGCMTSSQDAGIEIKNGNCVGIIYNKDQTVAVGAVVELIPAGYDPANPSSGRIDSTVTDNAGQYAFDVDSSTFYNIIATKGPASCLMDSISVLVDGHTTASDTLQTSGKLAGRVVMLPGDDPRSAVVLLMGTNMFTTPDDSTGGFPDITLPAGRYIVKAFSSANGYGVYDSTITIVSGTTTELTVRIPSGYAAEIKNFSVVLDSATLQTTLKWTPGGDTSLLTSYVIRRFVNGVVDSVIVVDKSTSEFVDDCITYYDDAVNYSIAAIGKSFREGYAAVSPNIVVSGNTLFVRKKTMPKFIGGKNFNCVAGDSSRGYFLSDGNTIVKTDAEGAVLKTLSSLDIVRNTEFGKTNIISPPGVRELLGADPVTGIIYSVSFHTNYLYTDDYGHLFTCMTIDMGITCRIILKFDQEIDKIGEVSIPDTFFRLPDTVPEIEGSRPIFDEALFVADDGSIFFEISPISWQGSPLFTRIIRFTPDLQLAGEITLDGENSVSQVIGDTVIIISPLQPYSGMQQEPDSRKKVMLFDGTFNLLSSYTTINAYERFNGKISYTLSPDVFMITGNLYLTKIACEAQIFVFSDRSGSSLARYVMPEDFRICRVTPQSIFGISYTDVPVLYEISLDQVLQQ